MEKILKSVPKGYKRVLNTSTNPMGTAWYSNNESRFSGKRKSVLVKLKKVCE
jgi:hypothetical protein